MVESLADKCVADCQRYFETNYSLNVPDDWLRQCIEFLLEDGQCNQINECRKLVIKQLVDFDLNEIGTTCTSDSLFSKSKEGSIEGSHLFQISVCIDVTQPYYSKIQKLLGDENDNVNVNADIVPGATQFERTDMKKSRMLTLFLTDGTHSFKAIEYKTISFLNDDILPGTKIQLQGRMTHRNGVLFIGPENCKILGGYIENLSLPQKMIKMLQTELENKRSDQRLPNQREKSTKFEATYPVKSNKKDTNQPQNYTNTLTTMTNKSDFKVEQASLNMKKPCKFKQLYEGDEDDDDEMMASYNIDAIIKSARSPTVQTIKNRNNVHVDDDDDDDEILAKCDLDSILKSACSPLVKPAINGNRNNSGNNNIKRQQSVDMISKYNRDGNKKSKTDANTFINDSDEDDILLVQSIGISSNTHQKPTNKATVHPIQQKSVIAGKNETKAQEEDDDDIFNQFLEGNLEEKTKVPPTKIDPSMFSLKDLISVSKLESCCCKNVPNMALTSFSTCVHVKKCSIQTLVGKIGQTKLKWHQDCLISDGTIHMEVYIGNTVLSEFLELTCQQAKILFKSAQEEQKEGKFSHSKAIFETSRKNCETKLESIKRCEMHLQFDLDKKKFCITKMENIEK